MLTTRLPEADSLIHPVSVPPPVILILVTATSLLPVDGEDQFSVSVVWFWPPFAPEAEGVPGDPYGVVVAGALALELGATEDTAVTVMEVACPLAKPPTVCPGVMGPDWPVLAR